MGEMGFNHYLSPIQKKKKKLKWMTELNVNTKTIEMSRRNRRKSSPSCDGQRFLSKKYLLIKPIKSTHTTLQKHNLLVDFKAAE